MTLVGDAPKGRVAAASRERLNREKHFAPLESGYQGPSTLAHFPDLDALPAYWDAPPAYREATLDEFVKGGLFPCLLP
jgi:hypothetical protein